MTDIEKLAEIIKKSVDAGFLPVEKVQRRIDDAIKATTDAWDSHCTELFRKAKEEVQQQDAERCAGYLEAARQEARSEFDPVQLEGLTEAEANLALSFSTENYLSMTPSMTKDGVKGFKPHWDTTPITERERILIQALLSELQQGGKLYRRKI